MNFKIMIKFQVFPLFCLNPCIWNITRILKRVPTVTWTRVVQWTNRLKRDTKTLKGLPRIFFWWAKLYELYISMPRRDKVSGRRRKRTSLFCSMNWDEKRRVSFGRRTGTKRDQYLIIEFCTWPQGVQRHTPKAMGRQLLLVSQHLRVNNDIPLQARLLWRDLSLF